MAFHKVALLVLLTTSLHPQSWLTCLLIRQEGAGNDSWRWSGLRPDQLLKRSKTAFASMSAILLCLISPTIDFCTSSQGKTYLRGLTVCASVEEQLCSSCLECWLQMSSLHMTRQQHYINIAYNWKQGILISLSRALCELWACCEMAGCGQRDGQSLMHFIKCSESQCLWHCSRTRKLTSLVMACQVLLEASG